MGRCWLVADGGAAALPACLGGLRGCLSVRLARACLHVRSMVLYALRQAWLKHVRHQLYQERQWQHPPEGGAGAYQRSVLLQASCTMTPTRTTSWAHTWRCAPWRRGAQLPLCERMPAAAASMRWHCPCTLRATELVSGACRSSSRQSSRGCTGGWRSWAAT